MTEQERDELIAECYALRVKAYKTPLTHDENERFETLLECGMLPSQEKPYQPIAKERDAYLRYLAWFRIHAGRDVPLMLESVEESRRVLYWMQQLSNEALADAVSKSVTRNKVLQTTLTSWMLRETKRIDGLDKFTAGDAELFALLLAVNTETGKPLSYKEIGAELRVSDATAHRAADDLFGRHAGLREWMQKQNPRKPRGRRVTK